MSLYRLRNWIPLSKIDWLWLSRNPNPNAVSLLEQNLDKVDWVALSSNPNAIHILEQNLDKVHWGCLLKNPSILELDYEALRNRLHWTYGNELIETMFHPSNIDKFEGWGFYQNDEE
jgi:hypothetical protein